MIRDFKQFSGLTPAEYGSLQGEFMRHVPVEERGQICPIPATEPFDWGTSWWIGTKVA